MLAIVGFMVTATSGIPDGEQGMATGLATMTQQIGITMGTPIMSAVVVTAPVLLDGIGLAVLVNAAIVAVGAVLAGVFLGRK